MNCRHCGTPLTQSFIDLGFAPPSNAYLDASDLNHPEVYYPLRVKVCDQCWLVQTEDYAGADDLFKPDYAYFSSTSSSWLAHATRYADMITERLSLDSESFVIEVASNDGYLLRNFVKSGIPCLGIEPTASTAAAAESIGVPVLRQFFSKNLGLELAAAGQQADLIIGNNVYAHVPDINDFTQGLASALKPKGSVTLEFPHLLPLIKHTQFDTVYHEHFSYLSLTAVAAVFTAAGLRIWDVEQLETHGGSLRVYGCLSDAPVATSVRVARTLQWEERFGISRLETYSSFQTRADRIKNEFLTFLLAQKKAGRPVAAYGAAAKANTLLNYAGVKPDLLPYICDAATAKQDKLMPGSHIPIRMPDALREQPPEFVVIFPWNIATEVRAGLADLIRSGTRAVVAVPKLRLL